MNIVTVPNQWIVGMQCCQILHTHPPVLHVLLRNAVRVFIFYDDDDNLILNFIFKILQLIFALTSL